MVLDRVSLIDVTTNEYLPLINPLPVSTASVGSIAVGGGGYIFVDGFYQVGSSNRDGHVTIWRIEGMDIVELSDSQAWPSQDPWAVSLLGAFGDDVYVTLGSMVLSLSPQGGPLTPKVEFPVPLNISCWVVDKAKSVFGCNAPGEYRFVMAMGRGTPPLPPGFDPGPVVRDVQPRVMAIDGKTLLFADPFSVHRLVPDE
jgi:hypothetical protein